jgi:hypothetical protein
MVSSKTIANERALRTYILRNLNKEYHANTKPSIDFIKKLLDDAYAQGLRYDVSDFKEHILNFAANSTNNATYCIELALSMKYRSEHDDEGDSDIEEYKDKRLVFFDIEVFPNLFLVCWKFEGAPEIIRMFNPGAADIEKLLDLPLVGFNNRRYDNHILYAAYIGYGVEELYELSRKIIVRKDKSALFREAYGISYADVYDYTTKKQSLKHWEVELGLKHTELDVDWDKPLPEESWYIAAEYCEDDVRATEAVHQDRIDDFHAREILADLSGLRVNHSTMSHAAKIIFGSDRRHKNYFEYPDLSEEFPGYVFNPAPKPIDKLLDENLTKAQVRAITGKSHYRDEIVGEGGYVWAKPGMYSNVLYMDVASMHPTSIEIMNLFGKYTKAYSDLKEARLLIKQGNIVQAGRMFGGRLDRFLKESDPEALSYALKIALNIVYGFTSAQWDNPFKDERNIDNVVAKRGALFMVDLKYALLERGTNVIHFKTDSVKVADYTEEDIEFIKEFGKKYGYTFEVEAIYDRLVLINDAVLAAVHYVDDHPDSPIWSVVGARFAVPYVHKTLFTREPIEFEDLIETRSVKVGTMYIEQEDGTMNFVGRIGQFCPMTKGGGILYRVTDEGKKFAVTGTSGFRWQQTDIVKTLELEKDIDLSYFEALTEEAMERIAEFGDPSIFLGD